MSETEKEQTAEKPEKTNGKNTAAKKEAVKDSTDNTAGVKTTGKHAWIYLGPNLPGGVLFNGGVYKQMPEHLCGVFEKAPEIRDLFIEVCSAPLFKRELERKGSKERHLYQNAEALIRAGVLNNGGV